LQTNGEGCLDHDLRADGLRMRRRKEKPARSLRRAFYLLAVRIT
jgi:hypothetical protein